VFDVLVGDVGLSVTDPQGLEVPVTTEATKNNSFKIGLEPTKPGVYEAAVYFGDEQVPGSPFRVKCHDMLLQYQHSTARNDNEG